MDMRRSSGIGVARMRPNHFHAEGRERADGLFIRLRCEFEHALETAGSIQDQKAGRRSQVTQAPLPAAPSDAGISLERLARCVRLLDPGTRALARAIMLETQQVAERLGVKFRVDVERRIEGARKLGAHKTSMLQDLEHKRPMEIDPLVTVVQEIGRMTGVPTPTLDTVLALVLQRAKVAGLYKDDSGLFRPAEDKQPAFA